VPKGQHVWVRHYGASESKSRLQVEPDISPASVFDALEPSDVLDVEHGQDVDRNAVYALLDRSKVGDRVVVSASAGFAHVVPQLVSSVSYDVVWSAAVVIAIMSIKQQESLHKGQRRNGALDLILAHRQSQHCRIFALSRPASADCGMLGQGRGPQ